MAKPCTRMQITEPLQPKATHVVSEHRRELQETCRVDTITVSSQQKTNSLHVYTLKTITWPETSPAPLSSDCRSMPEALRIAASRAASSALRSLSPLLV